MDLIMTGLEFFHKGGPVMYVLLLCSVFVVAIAVERAGFFKREDAGRSFAQAFADKITRGDAEAAEKLAENTKGILPKLLVEGLNYGKDENIDLNTSIFSDIFINNLIIIFLL